MIIDSLSILAILTSVSIVVLLIWNCLRDDCSNSGD